MDLLELRGSEFLQVYAGLFVAAVVLGLVLRRVFRARGGAVENAAQLDPYEVAYLAGGPRLAVNTAIAGLYHGGAIRLEGTPPKLVSVGDPGRSRPGLEREVHRYVAGSSSRSVQEVHRAGGAATAARRPLELGLALSGVERFQVGLLSVLPLLFLAALGVAKMFVGVSRDRPVVFLGFFLFATLVAIVMFLSKTPRRTLSGDAAIRGLRAENAALQSTARSQPASLGAAELAMAMGLFGAATVLRAGPLSDLRNAIIPPGSTGGSSGCGSGCGGGGGGGDGGGGGCGGCGGGGGD